MQVIDKNVFQDLAYNDHREALFTLYREVVRAQAERDEMVAVAAAQQAELTELRAELAALQATVLELATVVNAPAEA